MYKSLAYAEVLHFRVSSHLYSGTKDRTRHLAACRKAGELEGLGDIQNRGGWFNSEGKPCVARDLECEEHFLKLRFITYAFNLFSEIQTWLWWWKWTHFSRLAAEGFSQGHREGACSHLPSVGGKCELERRWPQSTLPCLVAWFRVSENLKFNVFP